ncbi:MAG: twin transmembrane helix small protein [Alphaproteobacteria bacterium]|nr:twin transmembrane helix small protein [Alphaproteobacteria bacterium]
MSGTLPIILIGFMIATAIVLVIGIFLMAQGGEANRKYGNKMMVMRVVLQACALATFAALLVSKA